MGRKVYKKLEKLSLISVDNSQLLVSTRDNDVCFNMNFLSLENDASDIQNLTLSEQNIWMGHIFFA